MEEGERDNRTLSTDFVLLGISDVPTHQNLLFLLLLTIYSVTMVGNILFVVLVVADRQLHTPMYFFLGNLSSLEACYSSTILPRLLVSFLTGHSHITAHGCMAQFYFFASLVTTECYLLVAMSCDRYLAIGQPLLYRSLMTWKVCIHLAVASWLWDSLLVVVVTVFLSQLQFCGSRTIDHFFCEFTPLLEVACSNTRVFTCIGLIFAFLNLIFSFIFTLASYVCIIAIILVIPSSISRQKAFSTCSSHLTIVTVFYGTLFVIYMLPRTARLRQLNKVFSLFYTALTPLANPLICSLQNRGVRETLRKMIRKCSFDKAISRYHLALQMCRTSKLLVEWRRQENTRSF